MVVEVVVVLVEEVVRVMVVVLVEEVVRMVVEGVMIGSDGSGGGCTSGRGGKVGGGCTNGKSGKGGGGSGGDW